MSSSPSHPQIARGDHKAYMAYALSLARLSPPKPTNFRVGALLLDVDRNAILATGYTLELPGNTHAEQSCFAKLAREKGVVVPASSSSEEELELEAALGALLPANTVLYTTMEPCNARSPGNATCVERILRCGRGRGIKAVYVGVEEPETFVGRNLGRRRLVEAGVRVEVVGGLEEEILEVAMAGHRGEGGL